jgi:hypothetical protein
MYGALAPQEDNTVKLSLPTLAGGTLLFFAGAVLLASPAIAQTTGTSHPENLDDDIVVAAPQTPAAPAPALQTRTVAVAPAPRTQTDDIYKPYQPLGQTAGEVRSAQLTPAVDPADADIVTSYPYDPNALVEGTLIKVRLVGLLSTESTRPGSHFVATLTENVLHDGKVILPVGASLEGRVTEVRGGKRIGGGSAIHLEPETVALPDGTLYRLSARVIDVDAGHSTRVNDEGTIVGGNHTKGHVTTLAATTGGGAVTGAVLGGGVGAAVGAGIGAGVGTVLWLNQDRQQTLDEGTVLVFSLNRPMGLTPTTASNR